MDFLLTIDDSPPVAIPLDLWHPLVAQVATRSLHEWQYIFPYPAPLGNPQVRRVIQRIDSTACFQLFLASVEISELLRIVAEPLHVPMRFAGLSGVFTRLGGNHGLYFPPQDLIAATAPAVLNELIRNNKLCSMRIVSDDPNLELETAYVPYATPNTLSARMTPDANRLWVEVRRLYRIAGGY